MTHYTPLQPIILTHAYSPRKARCTLVSAVRSGRTCYKVGYQPTRYAPVFVSPPMNWLGAMAVYEDAKRADHFVTEDGLYVGLNEQGR